MVGRVARASRSQPIALDADAGKRGRQGQQYARRSSRAKQRTAPRREETVKQRDALEMWTARIGRRIPPLSAPGVLEVWRVHGLDGRREKGVHAHGCGAPLVCGWSLRIRGQWWMRIGRVRAARRGPHIPLNHQPLSGLFGVAPGVVCTCVRVWALSIITRLRSSQRATIGELGCAGESPRPEGDVVRCVHCLSEVRLHAGR